MDTRTLPIETVILVVEDDVAVRKFLTLALQRLGFVMRRHAAMFLQPNVF